MWVKTKKNRITYGTCTDTSKGLCLNPSVAVAVAVAVAVGKICGMPGTQIGFRAAVSRAFICNCEKRRKDIEVVHTSERYIESEAKRRSKRGGSRGREKEGEREVLRQKDRDRDREERKLYIHIYVYIERDRETVREIAK